MLSITLSWVPFCNGQTLQWVSHVFSRLRGSDRRWEDWLLSRWLYSSSYFGHFWWGIWRSSSSGLKLLILTSCFVISRDNEVFFITFHLSRFDCLGLCLLFECWYLSRAFSDRRQWVTIEIDEWRYIRDNRGSETLTLAQFQQVFGEIHDRLRGVQVLLEPIGRDDKVFLECLKSSLKELLLTLRESWTHLLEMGGECVESDPEWHTSDGSILSLFPHRLIVEADALSQ